MPRSSIDITVLVCTCNRAEILRSALASLACQQTEGRFAYEVLVIDNASSDNTQQVVEQAAEAASIPIRYVLEPCRGRVFARNRGIQESCGQWIALFDDDQIADPSWLRELLSLAQEKNVRSVGGAVALRLPEGCRRDFSWTCRRMLGESVGWTEPRPYTRKEGPGAGNEMLHRSVFEEVGMYDESYNLRGEDTDLYRRIRAAGIVSWYTPKAIVWHVIPPHRLEASYFYDVSVQTGWAFAQRDAAEWGRLAAIGLFFARVAQAAMRTIPRLVRAKLAKNDEEVLAARCLIWRLQGYRRAVTAMVLQRWLPSGASTMPQNQLSSRCSETAPKTQPPVKVLVVGQTPPPYHGQALMIERLLRGQFARVRLYHVRMAFSDSIDDVGRFRIGKVFHLLGVMARIVYHRTIHGATVLYYPPAGPNRVPLYRDLVILNCTRWMFRRTILHFHAGGVSELYPHLSRPAQWLFRRALFHADAAIRVSYGSPDDSRKLAARCELVVPYGIEDEFERLEKAEAAAPRMLKSMKAAAISGTASNDSTLTTAVCELDPLRILFVGILRESKGLLVLLEACGLLADRQVPFELTVVGQFQSRTFEAQVRKRIDELEISRHVRFLGLLHGDAKWQAYANADVFCFPTFYEAETFGIVLVEAMSFGLPVVATNWRGIPEIVDNGQSGFLVEPHDAAAVADRLTQLHADPQLRERLGAVGRRKFLREFTTEQYLRRMEEVIVEAASKRGESRCREPSGTEMAERSCTSGPARLAGPTRLATTMKLKHLTSKLSELRQHPGYRRNPPVVLWRAAAWSAHCLLGMPARARFRRWDFRLYLPPKWRGGGCTSPYLFREEYEPELRLLERFLEPGMTFIDGGANTGVFTFAAAHLVGPQGRVVAFEPGAACFAALNQSLRLNDARQVKLWQQALSNRRGIARFYHHHDQENSFSLGGDGGVTFEEISTTTLDTVAAELNLERVDFIKLDVEGAEELVFRGAREVLSKYRPLLLFEVNPEAAARLSLTADGACRVLAELDYRFFRMDDRGELQPVETADEFGNLLAVPAEKVAQRASGGPLASASRRTKRFEPLTTDH